MTYTKDDVRQWILGAFKVSGSIGHEIQFPCPKCQHEACYYNVNINQGYCHRASCHFIFGFEALQAIIGHPPELTVYVVDHAVDAAVDMPVELPKYVKPIYIKDQIVQALATRGVTWDMIVKFQIQQTDKRVFVPIYDKGTLVQFNSRRINRTADIDEWFKAAGPKPYKYASGAPITNYFLGWEECKAWENLVLVENTFVSMWLRDLNCTTNFGSHLSDVHIDKLVHSHINHVTFLWDEGANAQKAQRKLTKVGIPSTIIKIKGQPDDYSKYDISKRIKSAISIPTYELPGEFNG